MYQMDISRQQSIPSDMHQPINCKETAADEMVPQYGVANKYGYNPESSDFLFPDMYPFQENEPHSTHLQLPSEESKVFINQNLQNFQLSNSEHSPNNSMSIAEPGFLPGFQQTFDQRTVTINPTAQPSMHLHKLYFLKCLTRKKCHPIFHPSAVISLKVALN
ncbi:hypothetical protein CEXT_71711 [Caerostris extrusa]|uniref:Uncharacterized protein n=1 Tax=Caerostris extrusa TaxID=172846 RepID=A0AAV4T250_CAEEX|nr:hypothetical protein CEXT_71711 [Caerostris extrusa]